MTTKNHKTASLNVEIGRNILILRMPIDYRKERNKNHAFPHSSYVLSLSDCPSTSHYSDFHQESWKHEAHKDAIIILCSRKKAWNTDLMIWSARRGDQQEIICCRSSVTEPLAFNSTWSFNWNSIVVQIHVEPIRLWHFAALDLKQSFQSHYAEIFLSTANLRICVRYCAFFLFPFQLYWWRYHCF